MQEQTDGYCKMLKCCHIFTSEAIIYLLDYSEFPDTYGAVFESGSMADSMLEKSHRGVTK